MTVVRALRYPRLSVLACALTLAAALGRDACIGAGLDGWSRILLYATFLGLACCFMLMSSRIIIDDMGIGIGFLLSVRHANWDELAALGALCCNSGRMYLYGMYRGHTEFVYLLHQAPRCGSWGFVAPLNEKLAGALRRHCPYPVDLSPVEIKKRPAGMRLLWHQTAAYALLMIPAAVVAFLTGGAMLVYSAGKGGTLSLALGAAVMLSAGVFLIKRTMTTLMTCPAISEAGVCIGRGLYMPWEEVRFAYIHRIGQISGLFLLTRELGDVSRHGTPPVLCLSMPDTSTVLLAYLTYCPHAPKEPYPRIR